MKNPAKRKAASARALAVLVDLRKRGWPAWNAAGAAIGLAPSPPGQFWAPNPMAIVFWREFVAAGGLDLDPEIWFLDHGAVAGVALAVEEAIANGLGGDRAASRFMSETPQRHEWLRVDDGYLVSPCADLYDYLSALFITSINRSHLAVQVAQQLADPGELDLLDEKPWLPECSDED